LYLARDVPSPAGGRWPGFAGSSGEIQ